MMCSYRIILQQHHDSDFSFSVGLLKLAAVSEAHVLQPEPRPAPRASAGEKQLMRAPPAGREGNNTHIPSPGHIMDAGPALDMLVP